VHHSLGNLHQWKVPGQLQTSDITITLTVAMNSFKCTIMKTVANRCGKRFLTNGLSGRDLMLLQRNQDTV